MLTIITKYIAPTNTRGARIKVISQYGNKFYSYDHSASCAHKAAFDTWLKEKNAEMMHKYPDCQEAVEVNWFKLVAYAGTPDQAGFAFIIK